MSDNDILKALSQKLNELKQELSDSLTSPEDGDSLLKAAREDEGKKYIIPIELPVLPIREILVFPYMVVPLLIGRELSIKSVEEAMAGGRKIVLATQKDVKNENPGAGDLCVFGIAAEILQLL